MNRLFLSLVILSFFQYGKAFSQQREILRLAQNQLEEHQYVSDSIVNNLIKIANDTLSSDSLKVDIVHLFGELCCDICLAYLIEHVNDRFSYGRGISDIDQDNATACYSILGSISVDKNQKWMILQPIFNSLRQKEQNETFINKMSRFINNIFGKNIAKTMIQYEFEENRKRYGIDPVYEKNLLILLNGS